MKRDSHDTWTDRQMEVRLGLRLCETGSLKDLPCSDMLPASCRLLCQRQKHLHVDLHQQRSRSWIIQLGMKSRSSLGTQGAAVCHNTPGQGGEDGEWLCKVNIWPKLDICSVGRSKRPKDDGLYMQSSNIKCAILTQYESKRQKKRLYSQEEQ